LQNPFAVGKSRLEVAETIKKSLESRYYVVKPLEEEPLAVAETTETSLKDA